MACAKKKKISLEAEHGSVILLFLKLSSTNLSHEGLKAAFFFLRISLRKGFKPSLNVRAI